VPEWQQYRYHATVESVYDGDTVTLVIDAGMDIMKRERVRLMRINAPEMRLAERPDGLKSRDYLRSLLPAGKRVDIQTFKDRTDKYGRYLAEIQIDQGNVSDLMAHSGHAVYQNY